MDEKKPSQTVNALSRRQIELLGLALSNNGIRPADLQVMLGFAQATFGRDASKLRSCGIDILSEGKRVKVRSSIDPQVLEEIIEQYVACIDYLNTADRATEQLVKYLKARALYVIVVLERAIEASTMVEIDYEKRQGLVERKILIGPMLLVRASDEWRVLAIHEGNAEHFVLSKIHRINQTEKAFVKLPKDEIRAMLHSKRDEQPGPDRYLVKLQCSKALADQFRHEQFAENQTIALNPDGSSVVEAHVASLTGIAQRIVALGSGIIVLEPSELRQEVIELANQTLQNYA